MTVSHRSLLSLLPAMLIAFALTAALRASAATEYFVGIQGADTNSGLTRAAAFATVQRGVDALAPGDTLTILPGEYLGAVRRDGLGDSNVVTTIRAATPGTAILRGDVLAPEFQRLDGHRFVYVADFDFDGPIPAVNELDTLTILKGKPNATELEFVPGTFHYDQTVRKLYLSSSDMQPPDQHRYTVSVVPTHGIYLRNAQRVVIEGLGVTGFNALELLNYRSHTLGGTWGIFLAHGRACMIRDCRVWLNGWGIGLNSESATSGDNIIERCAAWANDSQFKNGDMGGLTGFKVRRDVIRDSVAFRNGMYGVNIYGTGTDGGSYGESDVSGNEPENRSRLINNLAWGNSAADVKIKTGVQYFHTVERSIGPGLWSVRPDNVSSSIVGRSIATFGPDTIVLSQETNLNPRAEFVDPDRHDYRLRPDSRFRGTGPDGRDRGPHPYDAAVVRNTEIRPASAACAILGCDRTQNLSPADRALLAALNAPASRELRIVSRPRIHSSSATTANIEWRLTAPAACELAWGETPTCTNTTWFDVGHFGTYSLTGLTPGKRYYFTIRALRHPSTFRQRVGIHPIPDILVRPEGDPLVFTTADEDAAPRVYHVAPDGANTHDGRTRENAWRTVQHAADHVRVGDTVLITAGEYDETVRLRVTGSADAPITFRCAPGAKVVMAGANKQLSGAFIVSAKSHLRFDGFTFRDYNLFGNGGDFKLYRGRDIRLSRCLSDGRGGYSATFLDATEIADLVMENCVALNKMSGVFTLERCPEALIRNNVFGRPMIGTFVLNNRADQTVVMENNIFTDMMEKKAVQNISFAELEAPEALHLKNNCFFARCFPPKERKIFTSVDHAATKATATYTIAEFDAAFGATRTRFADPLFAGDPGARDDPADKSGFSPERLMDPALELDYDAFFATNPEVVKRGIGLRPEAFADMNLMD